MEGVTTETGDALVEVAVFPGTNTDGSDGADDEPYRYVDDRELMLLEDGKPRGVELLAADIALLLPALIGL